MVTVNVYLRGLSLRLLMFWLADFVAVVPDTGDRLGKVTRKAGGVFERGFCFNNAFIISLKILCLCVCLFVCLFVCF